MSSKTTVTSTPTPAEQAYLDSQQALAKQQLQLLSQQGSFQTDYLNSIKPILDQQSQLLQTQLAQANSPAQADLNQKLLAYMGNQTDVANQQLALTKQQLTQAQSPEAQAVQQQALDYQAQQIAVAKQQLALTQQQIDQMNDPTQKAIQQQAADLQLQQLQVAEQQLTQQQQEYQSGQPLRDLQTQLAQAQLDQLKNGYAPTQQQIDLINQGTQSALNAGNSSIDNSLAQLKQQLDTSSGNIDAQQKDALRQLTQDISPSLGLRPTDTPILDRGDLIGQESLRLKGQLANDYASAQSQALNEKSQLASNLETQNANARLNFPLQVAGVINPAAQFEQSLGFNQSQAAGGAAGGALNYPLTVAASASTPVTLGLNSNVTGNTLSTIGSATQDFQQSLQDAANQNRASLLGLSGNAVNSGISGGNSLATGIRINPLDNFNTTTTKSDPMGTISGILGGLGGLGQGLGAMGLSLSDKRLKTDITTAGYDSRGRRWVNFRFRGDPAKHTGLIAQETAKTDPHAVFTDGLGLKYIDYSKLDAA